jgi:hypothetical protein
MAVVAVQKFRGGVMGMKVVRRGKKTGLSTRRSPPLNARKKDSRKRKDDLIEKSITL